MDDFRKFRYDFFGEFVSQEERNQGNKGNFEGSLNQVEVNRMAIDDQQQQHTELQHSDLSKALPDDSLMEFITDYFQGDVSQDLSMQENCDDDEGKAQNEQMSHTNAFEYSSNSDANTSIELFTSPEASMINMDRNCSGSSGFCDSDLLSPPPEEDKSVRRKSISYEILFTNSKEKNGQVKVHIIPNHSKYEDVNKNQVEFSTVGQCKKLDQKEKETLQQEHIGLHQRIQELERKLHCLEVESERIVGELSRIIERKNETIVQLELELAGVKMEN